MKKQFTGIGRYAYNLVHCLAKIDRDNEYFLYTPRPLFDFKRVDPSVRSRNFHVKRDIFGRGQAATLRDVDIYHAPCPEPMMLKGPRIIVSIHDLVYKAYPQGHTASTIEMTDREISGIVERADKIVCSSHNTLEDMKKYFTVDPEKLCVIHLGMNLDEFRPLKAEEYAPAQKIIAQKGVSGEYLLFVGTREPRKNVKGILKAFALLKERNKFGGKLVIIGMKGWMSEDFAQLAADLKIKDEVIFPGFVTNQELRFFYGLSRALIFPSFYEGFGFPIVEAFCCGTPVVTSKTSSCGELAGEAALTVDPGDIEDIAAQMERVAHDEALRVTLKEKGLERAEKFSYERTARETLELYRKVYQNAGALK